MVELAARISERGDATIVMEILKGPFVWIVAILVLTCALVQFFVFGVEMINALRTGNDCPSLHNVDRALSLTMTSALLATAGIVLVFGPATVAFGAAASASSTATGLIVFGLIWVLLLFIVPIASSVGLLTLSASACSSASVRR